MFYTLPQLPTVFILFFLMILYGPTLISDVIIHRHSNTSNWSIRIILGFCI